MGGSYSENKTGTQTVDGVQLTGVQYFYWSGTEFAPNPTFAWGFYFFFGSQGSFDKGHGLNYGWAVHSGDVGAAVVPIPAAVWLFGSGLLGLIGIARRKAA